ncbi:YciI family protein [Rhodococcus opacus]|uniref:YciI family protein n=1 Tax=Rhodococcus opacus TaxID=37919 RepID=UPI001E499DC0|nr:YciI family protein [Rhodococcus opacus]
MFYATDRAAADRIPEVYPRHREYLDAFAADGGILGIGPFDDPASNGSMAVFSSRERAAQFIAHDPFVLEGIAHPSDIREWDALNYR